MKTQLENLDLACGALVDAEIGADHISQAARGLAEQVMTLMRIIIEGKLDASAAAFERYTQLKAAIRLDGVESALVAKAAHLLAEAAKAEAA